MQVERIKTAGSPPTARKAATADGFSQLLASPDADEAAPAQSAAASRQTLPVGMLTYEAALDRVQADRQARRHGRAMLQALGALQLSLLGDGRDGGAPACAKLADLAGSMPEADDPVLRLILREIGVRAAVELARHAAPANISIG